MATLRRRGRYWYHRFIDADGERREVKGATDRRVTEQLAAATEVEAARIRAGLADPASVKLREHEARPLAEHLDEFQAGLLAKGDTTKHARLYCDRARRVAERCGATRLSHLTASRVQQALAELRAEGLASATCNHYRAAIRGFSSWARKDGRLRNDPLLGVTGFHAEEDRRHDRRTLGVDELRRLVQAAHDGSPYRGIAGADRALCYRLAVATGLRYAEINSITPESSSDLDGESPQVTVGAGYTKNRTVAVRPLPRDVAEDPRPWLRAKPADRPVFPLPARGADMLRVDLQAAGITYRDAAGKVFDFHALRCQCATLADRAGGTPRVVQKMMHHSTLDLAGRYTRPRDPDLEEVAGLLPSLRPEAPGSGASTIAGLDPTHQQPLAPLLPHPGDVSGRELTPPDATTPGTPEIAADSNALEEWALGEVGRVLSRVAAEGLEPPTRGYDSAARSG